MSINIQLAIPGIVENIMSWKDVPGEIGMRAVDSAIYDSDIDTLSLAIRVSFSNV